jgi:hypothetical protein
MIVKSANGSEGLGQIVKMKDAGGHAVPGLHAPYCRIAQTPGHCAAQPA